MKSKSINKSDNQFCWLSGWTASYRPSWWFGPWFLHIAHIASGGAKAIRTDDIRAVVLLSPLCHQLHVSNSDSLPKMSIGGSEWPTIDERHTLWIKRRFDPENYDPDYLQSIWNGVLPNPERPPDFWMETMYKSQGLIG